MNPSSIDRTSATRQPLREAEQEESRVLTELLESDYTIERCRAFLLLLFKASKKDQKDVERYSYRQLLSKYRGRLVHAFRTNMEAIPTELVEYARCASNTQYAEAAEATRRPQRVHAENQRLLVQKINTLEAQILKMSQIVKAKDARANAYEADSKMKARIDAQAIQEWGTNLSRYVAQRDAYNQAQFQGLKDRLGNLEKRMDELNQRNQFLKKKVQFLEGKVKSLQEPAKESSPVLSLQHDTEQTASPLMQVQTVAKGGTGNTTDSASVKSLNGYWRKREDIASSAPTHYGEETPPLRRPGERKKVPTSTRARLPEYISRVGNKFRVRFGGRHVGYFKNLKDAKTAVRQQKTAVRQQKRRHPSSSSECPTVIDTPLKRRRSGKNSSMENSWMGFSNYPPLRELVGSICKASHTSKKGMHKKVAAKLWKFLNQEERDVFRRVNSDDAKSRIMKDLETKRGTLIAEIRTEAAEINKQAYSLFREEQPSEHTPAKFDGLPAKEKMMYVKMAQNSEYF